VRSFGRHLHRNQLADLADRRPADSEREQQQAHVAACPRCADALARTERLIRLMRTDESTDAPSEVIARAVRLVRPSAPAVPHRRRILAMPRFDSAGQTLAPGLRGAPPAQRQYLFGADDHDLDLRVAQAGAAWVVSGQVLGPSVTGRVELAGAAGTVEAEIDDFGEFTLPPVPAGTVVLQLQLGDRQIEVPSLEIGRADGAE